MRLAMYVFLFCSELSILGAAPAIDSMFNAASFVSGTSSPGGLATIKGSGLAASTAIASTFPLTSYLGSASVYVDGVAAPLLYVSPSQINFQIPWETPTGGATAVVIASNAQSNVVTFQVTPTSPGIFGGAVFSSAFGPAAQARRPLSAAIHAGEYITILTTGLGPVGNQPLTGAAPSEMVLSNALAPVSVTIDGVSATVAFAGLAPPGPNAYTAGMYQVNALVPDGAPVGNSIPVVVSSGGVSSPPVAIAIASGAAGSLVKFLELGPNGSLIARAITSENTCPAILLDGASQRMQTRAAPTLPFYPVLSCETSIPAVTKTVSIDGANLAMPVADLQRITVLGDTGCRMDASASQACYNAQAWPVAQIAASAAASNPQLLLHNGDYHYREVQCMAGADCQGSPWGYNWDVWREDLFTPFQSLLAAAPWIFVRGNHESCDRAGEGWFRFLDPRPMPAACMVYTDPYSMTAGPVQMIHVDSAQADDAVPYPDQIAAYMPQFESVRQMAGSNAWIVTHRPLWAIRSNLNSNVVMQAASGNALPAGVQLVMSGHTHTFQTYSFTPVRPPQIIIGNSGDNLAAAPGTPLVGALVGNATVTNATSSGGFGFATMIPAPGGGWTVTSRDSTGKVNTACNAQPNLVACQ